MITFEDALIISGVLFLMVWPKIIQSTMRWTIEKLIGKEINWTEV